MLGTAARRASFRSRCRSGVCVEQEGRRQGRGGSIVIKREEVVEGGHHGGAWKVAYADFVTAMMAFFLLMWLLNATTEEQRTGSPTISARSQRPRAPRPAAARRSAATRRSTTAALVSDRGAMQHEGREGDRRRGARRCTTPTRRPQPAPRHRWQPDATIRHGAIQRGWHRRRGRRTEPGDQRCPRLRRPEPASAAERRSARDAQRARTAEQRRLRAGGGADPRRGARRPGAGRRSHASSPST